LVRFTFKSLGIALLTKNSETSATHARNTTGNLSVVIHQADQAADVIRYPLILPEPHHAPRSKALVPERRKRALESPRISQCALYLKSSSQAWLR
jgi:hypothetical protein